MPKLTVKNFSVVKEAELDFGQLTVLIGPQASGKSLICKLSFFLLDSLNMAVRALGQQETLKTFRSNLKKQFLAEFPENTWGGEKFQIGYSHGRFEIGLRKIGTSDPEEGDLQLSLSEAFEETYQNALHSVRSLLQQAKEKDDPADLPNNLIEAWEFASTALRPLLGDGERETQLFIPAGRSFFTNFSKSFAAAQSRIDPVTSRFGQMMARAFDRNLRGPTTGRRGVAAFDSRTLELLRGRLDRDEGSVIFKTEDGRMLSLSQLSSGTQELLPLVLALRQIAGSTLSRTVYVEEPEAHLFPTTQYDLVKLFAWLSNSGPQYSRWVFTTHSPYILSAFNNLILAGQLGQHAALKTEVPISEECWIKPDSFAAYCIDDGLLKPILSDSGLIDGEYLDGVSEAIGNEFDSLLKLEYDRTKAS